MTCKHLVYQNFSDMQSGNARLADAMMLWCTCIPYTYKFSRHLNFEDVTNQAFSQFYFLRSPSILLSDSCKSKFANEISRIKIWQMASSLRKPQKLRPSKICTYIVYIIIEWQIYPDWSLFCLNVTATWGMNVIHMQGSNDLLCSRLW